MKLIQLTDVQVTALSIFFDSFRNLDRQIAECKNILSGNSFVPKVFIGAAGGVVQGATTNCQMDILVADQDESDHFIKAWDTNASIYDPGSVVDHDLCKSLFESYEVEVVSPS
ncbi:MAG: hypothetical protein Q7K26_01735 [bacterium]|nr:hypothetical protein [bacterium]